MDYFSFRRKLNAIFDLIQEAKTELCIKHGCTDEMSMNSNEKSLFTFLNENLDKYEELKLFIAVCESLVADFTRGMLQMERLTEENDWLKEELESLKKKILDTDKSILMNNVEMTKSKYVYQMRLANTSYSDCSQSEHNFFDLLEIENDNGENFKSEQTSVVSNKIRCLSTIIREYACHGQIEAAITICKQSINDIKQTKEDHPDIAILLCMLGFLYKDLHKWNEAANCIYDALKIREKVYGYETSIVASTLNNLAIILTGNNKYYDAENLCRKALEIREKLFGSKHESVAKQMNNLGLLLINIGLYSEGECLFHKALNIYKNLKNSELYYLKTSTNLANLYVKRGEFHKAELQLKNNLETIFKNRFKTCKTVINIIKIYEDKVPQKLDEKSNPRCLLSDQYLVAEIVNVKFLIQLYEKQGKRNNVAKLKTCLNNFSPNLIENEEMELLTDYINQKNKLS